MQRGNAYRTWELADIEGPEDGPYVDEPPEGIVVLATAEIVVEDESGPYLIVMCPRYEPLHSGGEPFGESGQWAPPYVVRKVPWTEHSCSLKHMLAVARDKYPEEESRMGMNELMLRWYTGLRDARLHSQFFEYKRSWSRSGSHRVYLIRRYTFASGEVQPQALADRELLRGFRFLPLGEGRYEEGADTYRCDYHDRDHRTFLGRPLATNIEYITKDETRREALRQQAIKLPSTAFTDRYSGLVLVGDLANYGAACAYAAKHMSSHELPGGSATVLRQRIASAFATLFSRCGIAHVQTAGDGFVCGIPDQPRNRTENLDRFLKAYIEFGLEVETMAAEIVANAADSAHPERTKDLPPPLGTRLGLTAGDYFFGKIGLAAASGWAFDGQDVIAASRLESALSNHTKKGADDALRHTVLVSARAEAELADHLRGRLEWLGKLEAHAKEFEDKQAMLYRVPVSPPPPTA